MPNVPDYSQYIGVKKTGVAQTANANTAVVKGRAPNRFDGYFPLYRSIRLPANALISNKFFGSSAAASPPAPFAPTSVGTLSLWLDATGLTNGASVGTWTDKTASAFVFTKGGITPVVTQIGGLNYVDTTSGGYFNNPSFLTPSSFSIFIVGYSSVNSIGLGDITAVISSSVELVLYMWRADQVFYAQYGNTIAPWRTITYSGDSSTTSRVMEFIVDGSGGGSSTYYTNGTSRGTTTGASSNGAQAGLNIGCRGAGGTSPWKGYIGEVLLYNGALAPADRQKIEGYLAWKWGLQANLPAGHPFLLGPPV